KSEGRKKPKFRRHKDNTVTHSGFGIRISFGFRSSDFGFSHHFGFILSLQFSVSSVPDLIIISTAAVFQGRFPPQKSCPVHWSRPVPSFHSNAVARTRRDFRCILAATA